MRDRRKMEDKMRATVDGNEKMVEKMERKVAKARRQVFLEQGDKSILLNYGRCHARFK